MLTKKIILSSIIGIFSLNLMAVTALNLDYRPNDLTYLRHTCPYDVMACPKDYDFSLNQVESKLLTSDDLNNILIKDKTRSIFVPLELNNSELITLAAATSLGVVAFKNDQEISNVIEKNQSKMAQTISTVGNLYGTGIGFGAIAAGSYFLGVYYDNNQLKKVGLFIIGAEMAQGLITLGVKQFFGRERPSSGNGPYHFFENGNQSFWSGHTATAFTLATVVSEMYKDEYPVVPYIAYGMAALTAYARVHDDHHWASDVIMGAVAGHLIAKLALSKFNDDGSRGGLSFYPSIDPITGTIMANFEWTPKQPEQPFRCAKMPDGDLKIRACLEEAFERSDRKKIFR